ncbi:ABC transporter permease [Microbacterium sp. PMB16]|uniref:ABC transporter permease n=1 Tax=Microbacterium sp. PMB16 TaxID=3120157 RepID=UPI003F4B8816
MSAHAVAPIARWMSTHRWRGLWRDPVLSVALIVCIAISLLALFGPLVSPHDPNETDILAANQASSPAHVLGTDSLGRDILSRILTGARLSMLGPAIIVIVATVLGVLLALSSAWIGGVFDSIVSKVLNIMFAIPAILVAILVIAVVGPGFWPPVVSLSLIYTPYIARVLKGAAAQERRRAYVESFQLAGFTSWRINAHHILRNLQPMIFAQATLLFGSAIVDFGALSFLGLGVPAPTAEWGAMVSAGRNELLAGNPQQAAAAGAMIVLTVVAFNVLGERASKLFGGAS